MQRTADKYLVMIVQKVVLHKRVRRHDLLVFWKAQMVIKTRIHNGRMYGLCNGKDGLQCPNKQIWKRHAFISQRMLSNSSTTRSAFLHLSASPYHVIDLLHAIASPTDPAGANHDAIVLKFCLVYQREAAASVIPF